MPAVVTENCSGCRFTECVTVCPVACFHGDENMLYVDDTVCIDCCACVPMCPVQAIYMEYDLPAELAEWAAINRERALTLPLVTEKATPLTGAAERRAALGL